MAYKEFFLDHQTPVKIFKRKNSRGLRITVGHGGQVRVSIPVWASYGSGLRFAASKKEWIDKHRVVPLALKPGLQIGKNHHLKFVGADIMRPKSRIVDNQIVISHPKNLDFDDPAVQSIAEATCIRALRQQANTLLSYRLNELAHLHGFEYSGLTIKMMKGRWGSCDQDKKIVLNLFLIQLPWESIDYVILHELIHTRVLKHGPNFWTAFSEVLPSAKNRQKQLRGYRPNLFIA